MADDFGISKSFSGPGLDLTRSGVVMGTPYYMAPEQAAGRSDLDHRADLWAVGIILYECLTGVRPFDAPNYNALMMDIATTRPKPLRDHRPDMPPGFQKIIDRALARDPNYRYPWAGVFSEDVAELRASVTDVMHTPGSQRASFAELEGYTPRPITGSFASGSHISRDDIDVDVVFDIPPESADSWDDVTVPRTAPSTVARPAPPVLDAQGADDIVRAARERAEAMRRSLRASAPDPDDAPEQEEDTSLYEKASKATRRSSP
jgi:serine/threonine protein kinase